MGYTFEPLTTYAAGRTVYDFDLGDVNGDGIPDVVSVTGRAVSVLLGDGKGGFAAPTTFNVGTSSFNAVSLADVNGDGKLDLVGAGVFTPTGGASVNSAFVLLGDGAGGFGAPAAFSTGATPYRSALVDLNGDGKLDFVSVDFGIEGKATVLLGDGKGGFGAATGFDAGVYPYALTVADVNADGKPDLVVNSDQVYDDGTSRLTVLLGDGKGGFAAPREIVTAADARTIAAADVNGDGRIDLVTADLDGKATVLLGDDTGGFARQTRYDLADIPYTVAVADVNGDGKLDIVTTNLGPFVQAAGSSARYYDGSTVSVLLGDGAGGFGPQTAYAVDDAPLRLELADLNRDGHLDIVAGSIVSGAGDTGQISVLLGTPTFAVTSASFASPEPAGRALKIGDVLAITLATEQPVAGITPGAGGATPTLALGNGGTAVYVGADAAGLHFAYTVRAGQDTADLAITGLSLNGASVSAAPSATLDVASLAAAPGLDAHLAVDATAPAAPVLALAHAGRLPDGTLVTNDRSVANLVVSGQEAGTTLHFSTDLGAPTTVYTPPTTDGGHIVYVEQWDAAGNRSPARALTFTLDTRAPGAPTLALARDTGASAADAVTSDAALKVATSEAGGALTYTVDGRAVDAYDPSLLKEGRHVVAVTQTDAAGNASAAGSITFTLDTLAPTVFAALKSDVGTGSEHVATDPTLVGRAEAGATVTLSEGATLLGTAAADATGHWSLTPAGLRLGTHTVVASETDAAGNTGSDTLAFTLVTSTPLVTATSDGGHDVARNDGRHVTVEHYDADWHLVAQTTTDEGGRVEQVRHERADGGHEVATYATPGAAHPATVDSFDASWRITSRAQLDGTGHVGAVDEVGADGSHTVETFRPGAAGTSTAATSESYDAGWHLLSRSTFDDQGRLTGVQQDNPDGTHTLAAYGVPGAAQPSTIDRYDSAWHITSRTQLDAAGHVTAVDHVVSDGSHFVESFAPDAPFAFRAEVYDSAWHLQSRTSYDAMGRIAGVQHDEADGTHAVASYAAGVVAHPATIDRFDAGWGITDRLTLDAAGKVSALDHVNADGTHVVDLFRAGSTTAYETDVLGADGHLVSSTGASGRGLPGYAAALVTEFDAGHVAGQAGAASAAPALGEHAVHAATLASVFSAGWALV